MMSNEKNPSRWVKGESGNIAGRAKGVPNKVTRDVREAYQNLVELNLENMSLWLMSVAADNPEKAMQLMLSLSEYVIPKLARQEITGKDGDDLFKDVKFQFGPDVNDPIGRDNIDFDLDEV